MEPGESDAEALRREVAEETGLAVLVGGLAGSVRRTAPAGGVYDIHDYRCTLAPQPGELRPGDDAADARWVGAAEYAALAVVGGLTTALAGWSALPTAP